MSQHSSTVVVVQCMNVIMCNLVGAVSEQHRQVCAIAPHAAQRSTSKSSSVMLGKKSAGFWLLSCTGATSFLTSLQPPSQRLGASEPRGTARLSVSSCRITGWCLSSTLTDVDASQLSLAELKEKILKRAAGVNRGLSCREEERQEIVSIVEQLEDQNSNVSPNDGFADGTSLLSGEWKLIFTSALDVLSLGLIPGVGVGQIFQNISEDGTEIANIVDLQPEASPVLERFTGSTSARLKVLAASSVEGDKRIALSFRSSQYSPQTLLGRDVSQTFPPLTINLPKLPSAGWVDTTFIDDDIRVARAFGGNLFVLARV